MAKDKYKSFEQLRRQTTRGKDYEIIVILSNAPVAVIAPHGGTIEFGTSKIARAIALDEYNFYCFEGLKQQPHHELHITSHNFDEQCCLDLISRCDVVVAIHGRKDKGDRETIFMGGLDTELQNAVSVQLKEAGFSTQIKGHRFPAIHPMNICNRGRRKMGAQLELPRSLRDILCDEKIKLSNFASAVRNAIQERSR